MRIDFRIRPPYKGFLDLDLYATNTKSPAAPNMFGVGQVENKSARERDLAKAISEMDEAGIDVAVIMGRDTPGAHGSVSLEDVAGCCAEYPGRFIGFGGVDSADPATAAEKIRKIADLGLRGVAFDNGWANPVMHEDADQLLGLYELCGSLGLIVSLTSSAFVGPDLSYSDPVRIQRAANAVPGTQFVIPHASWPWVVEACAVALLCPNVFLIPDLYANVPGIPGRETFISAMNGPLSSKFLYASSYPVRPIVQSMRDFESLKLESESAAAILGGNAIRLLGLQEAGQ